MPVCPPPGLFPTHACRPASPAAGPPGPPDHALALLAPHTQRRYELPPMYNNVLLQYRPDHGCCVHRFFKLPDNQTYWNDPWVYGGSAALYCTVLHLYVF